MIATLKEYAGEVATVLMLVLTVALIWLVTKPAEPAFDQETYNGAYVWCENQPDVESCRWGAFVALSPALNK